ncbi:hypothetical protein NX059_006503 [Plenodomus lindquistii]|nr:hypothetical protein NX059_006503 [Plenodomus lindquistii]
MAGTCQTKRELLTPTLMNFWIQFSALFSKLLNLQLSISFSKLLTFQLSAPFSKLLTTQPSNSAPAATYKGIHEHECAPSAAASGSVSSDTERIFNGVSFKGLCRPKKTIAHRRTVPASNVDATA